MSASPFVHPAHARLAVVLPADEALAASTVAALSPLLALRSEVCQLVFDPDPQGDLQLEVEAWVERHAAAIDHCDAVLMAGGPPWLPLALVFALSAVAPAGLLPLTSPQAFAAYAHKVLRLSGKPTAVALTTFNQTVDRQTRMVARTLVEPLSKLWREGDGAPYGPLTTIAPPRASRRALLEAIGADVGPHILLNSTHGERVPDERGMDTGAPVDQDGLPLRPEDLPSASQPCLEGGCAILFSCCSGGVPHERAWATLQRRGDVWRPEGDVIAPLGPALLAHPRGPLSVVVHIDTLFSWGLMAAGKVRPDGLHSPGMRPFAEMALSLRRGAAVATAFEPLRRARLRAEVVAGRALRQARLGLIPDDADRLLFPLMKWQDLRGWAIFGDPLVGLQASINP